MVGNAVSYLNNQTNKQKTRLCIAVTLGWVVINPTWVLPFRDANCGRGCSTRKLGFQTLPGISSSCVGLGSPLHPLTHPNWTLKTMKVGLCDIMCLVGYGKWSGSNCTLHGANFQSVSLGLFSCDFFPVVDSILLGHTLLSGLWHPTGPTLDDDNAKDALG